eukprot:138730-Amphidinium_carterae.1
MALPPAAKMVPLSLDLPYTVCILLQLLSFRCFQLHHRLITLQGYLSQSTQFLPDLPSTPFTGRYPTQPDPYHTASDPQPDTLADAMSFLARWTLTDACPSQGQDCRFN